jgi:hypothetical protein
VLLAFISAIAVTIGSVFDGDGDRTAADSTVATSASAASTATGAVQSDPATDQATDPATDPATTEAVSQVPSTASPASVLLLGDSEAGGLSPYLEPVIEQSGLVAMTTDYKVSSGLVRKDFFDWPARITELMGAQDPDIVIALFGGNDGQGFLSPAIASVESPEWRAEYAARVAEVVDIVTAGGRTLVWVGVPNAEDPSLTGRLEIQNDVVKTELAKHPGVIFVDSWSHFTGIDGGFAPYAIDPRDGESKPVRSETDGFHLNATGEEILAVYVNSAVTEALVALGATL